MKLTIRLDWDEAEAAYANLEFSDKDLEDHEHVMESIRFAWASVRGNYMTRTHGPKWQEKELRKKWKDEDRDRRLRQAERAS